MKAAGASYAFDNAAEETKRRFEALPAMFDAGTMRVLAERGLESGMACLEVGAGGGSIAAWLARTVAPGGRVLATDIDTRFLDGLCVPNLEVRRHDIERDPLPERAFDLIHTRLVLIHLPTRDEALARMIAALRPGGWIVIEDFDCVTIRSDPNLDPAQLRLKAIDALLVVLASRGVDLLYGRRVAGRLRSHGLTGVEAEARAVLCHGGSPGATLLQSNLDQLRHEILATGLLTESELDADYAASADPAVAFPSQVMWATWGRRPVE